jgi:hypothetical protein
MGKTERLCERQKTIDLRFVQHKPSSDNATRLIVYNKCGAKRRYLFLAGFDLAGFARICGKRALRRSLRAPPADSQPLIVNKNADSCFRFPPLSFIIKKMNIPITADIDIVRTNKRWGGARI